MAITYAWRIDSELFAYIVPPASKTDEQGYGYISKTPLIGEDLLSVKNQAEWEFGPDTVDGSINYLRAFNEMVGKLKGGPWYMDNIDLLSADIYYNVDASECADLRGVGIKGIRYIGAATEVDSNGKPIAFSPNVPLTITNDDGVVIPNPMIGGKFSVYGIYMEDQYDNDGNIKTNVSPENLFLVYNGANGLQGEGGENIYDSLEEYVDERIDSVDEQITEINNTIDQLEDKIELVSDFATFENVIYTLQALQATISGLTSANEELLERVEELEDELEAIKNPDVGDGGNTSEGSNVTVGEYDPNVDVYLVGIDESNTLYKIDRAKVDNYDIVINGDIYAKAQYKGEKLSIQ